MRDRIIQTYLDTEDKHGDCRICTARAEALADALLPLIEDEITDRVDEAVAIATARGGD